jgi:hypothetical protein
MIDALCDGWMTVTVELISGLTHALRMASGMGYGYGYGYYGLILHYV